MAPLSKLTGLDQRAAARFAGAGAGSVEAFLGAAASLASRRELARLTGLDEERVLGWARQADLMRVKGVGGQYAELLAAVGVASAAELARSHAPAVREAMVKANGSRPAPLRALPSIETVRRWVAAAARLPTGLEE